jgi:hypothetical protein
VRRRVALVAALAIVLIAGASAARGAGGGNGESGGDQAATGAILGGDTAEAVATEGRDLGPANRPRRGGGDVVCRLYDDAQPDRALGPDDFGPEVYGVAVSVLRICTDRETGEYVDVDIVTVTPPLAGATVDPRRLAVMARSRLPLPLPEARMNPAGEQTVNVETWLWVDNWTTQSRSATAGGVTSTVVATPIEQRWTFGSPGERKVCTDAGAPYDLGRRASEQSTSCSYTFRRSSAQAANNEVRVTATLVWRVTWSSNIGTGGDLGLVSRTTTIATRVAEHQALNDTRSS